MRLSAVSAIAGLLLVAFASKADAQLCFGFGVQSAVCQCNKLGYRQGSPEFMSCLEIMMRDGARRRDLFFRGLEMMAPPPPPPVIVQPAFPRTCNTYRYGDIYQTRCWRVGSPPSLLAGTARASMMVRAGGGLARGGRERWI